MAYATLSSGSAGISAAPIVPGIGNDLRIAVERLETLNNRLHAIGDAINGSRPETAESNAKHAAGALKYQSQEVISLLDRMETLVQRIEQGL